MASLCGSYQCHRSSGASRWACGTGAAPAAGATRTLRAARPGANLKRSVDGWDDEELGKLYDHQVVRRLLPYLKPYKKQVVVATIAMIIVAAASRVQPFLIGLAIDEFIPNDDLTGVAIIGASLLTLALAGWAAQWLQQIMTAFMGHRILLTLRTQMFNHIQKLSLSFLDRNEIGRVMSRVQNDVTVLQELLTTGFLTILADFVGLALVIFFLLLMDVQLTLVTFVGRAGAGRRDVVLAGPRAQRLHPRAAGDRGRQRQPAGERLRRSSHSEHVPRGRERTPLRPRELAEPERQRRRRARDGGGDAGGRAARVDRDGAGPHLRRVPGAGRHRFRSESSSRSRCTCSSSSTPCATLSSSTRSSSGRWPAGSASSRCSTRSRRSSTRRMRWSSRTYAAQWRSRT